MTGPNDLIERARGDAVLRHDSFALALLAILDTVRGGLGAPDVMTADLRTTAPGDGIGVFVHLHADGGVQAAPVVTEGRLDGIVTRSVGPVGCACAPDCPYKSRNKLGLTVSA